MQSSLPNLSLSAGLTRSKCIFPHDWCPCPNAEELADWEKRAVLKSLPSHPVLESKVQVLVLSVQAKYSNWCSKAWRE